MQPAQSYQQPAGYVSQTIHLSDESDSGPVPGPSSVIPPLDYWSGSDSAAKKRKIDRACDFCRRRKTKCDGPTMPNHLCTNCIQNRKTCTYIEASKPRGPPKAYVTALEDRVEKIDAILKRLRPNEDFTHELGPAIPRGAWRSEPAGKQRAPAAASASASRSPSAIAPKASSKSPSLSAPFTSAPLPHLARSSPKSPAARERRERSSDADVSSDSSTDTEDLGELSLARGLKRLTVRGLEPCVPADLGETGTENQMRFHGKSSSFKLIRITRRLKEMHRQKLAVKREADDESPISFNSPPLESAQVRDEFWTMPAWEEDYDGLRVTSPAVIAGVEEQFPPPDLARTLIDLYFAHVNSQLPLLHRPTFERAWMSGLHQRDIWFTCLCLCVFAVASRWSDDARVLPDRVPGAPEEDAQGRQGQRWLRAGWKYVHVAMEIHQIKRSIMHPAWLYEVQTHVLLGQFLKGADWGPVAWLLVSIGLRKAEDVGAHRRKVYASGKPTVEEELWKRTYWLLVVLDRTQSSELGRTCCSREEDFDLDMPLEVDDEYWENKDPELAFKQPPGKPCTITGFTLFIKLSQIVAFALRTIYAIDKSKVLLGLVGPRWRERIITELNTALTEWGEAVPPYLRWSENMENPLFANQASTLYTSYYFVQILIYRPFIRQQSLADPYQSADAYTPFPALAICSSAAQSCARIFQVQLPRGLSNIPNMLSVSHVCAAVLLLNVWSIKARERMRLLEDVKPPRADAAAGRQMEPLLADITAFMEALEWVEPRWEPAGSFLQNLRKSLPSPTAEVMPIPPLPPAHAHAPTYDHVLAAAPYYYPAQSAADDYLADAYAAPPADEHQWQWFNSPQYGYEQQWAPQHPPRERPVMAISRATRQAEYAGGGYAHAPGYDQMALDPRALHQRQQVPSNSTARFDHHYVDPASGMAGDGYGAHDWGGAYSTQSRGYPPNTYRRYPAEYPP